MNAPLKAVASTGKLEATMREIGREARRAAHVLALAPAARKNRALAAMAAAIRRSRSAILAANAEDVAEAKSAGVTRRFSRPADAQCAADRGHGRRARRHPQAQGSGRYRHGVMATSQRHAHRARAGAARRCRRDLRKPAQRHRRRRRAVPEGRQRRDPARRLRELPLGQGDPCRVGRRTRRSRAAGRRHFARADARARCRRHDACGARRHDRRDRAAWRQESGRARADRSARAGVRASRRRLSRLCRRRGQACDG